MVFILLWRFTHCPRWVVCVLPSAKYCNNHLETGVLSICTTHILLCDVPNSVADKIPQHAHATELF